LGFSKMTGKAVEEEEVKVGLGVDDKFPDDQKIALDIAADGNVPKAGEGSRPQCYNKGIPEVNDVGLETGNSGFRPQRGVL